MKNITRLDLIFSQFIRLRDTDENGIGKCIYCGHQFHYHGSNACHYIPRSNMRLRYDELNVNGGHVICNNEDDEEIHKIGLIEKYEFDVINYLDSHKHESHKYFAFEINEKIKYYRGRCIEFANKKNFKVTIYQ